MSEYRGVTNARGIPVPVASGGSTPGGSDTQVQYNNGGVLDGDAELTFDGDVLNFGTGQIVGTSSSEDLSIAVQTLNVSTNVTTIGGTTVDITAPDVILRSTASIRLGDTNGDLNSTILKVDDANQKVTSNVPVEVPDDAYGPSWDGSVEVPTKNALYDKIETISGGPGGESSFSRTFALMGC